MQAPLAYPQAKLQIQSLLQGSYFIDVILPMMLAKVLTGTLD